MKKTIILFASALALSAGAFAQEKSAPERKISAYGFIRTYAAFDSRECVAGTEDLFTYIPRDRSITAEGVDLNAAPGMRFAALTSRIGLDVKGFKVDGWNVAAKIETDFYAGLSGSTGTAQLRLRQAFFTMNKDEWNIKVGQAWHPMAADMPDIFSLNAGAPFGPFSRTPQATLDYKIDDKFTATASALWQMQYTSAGPDGASANYIKYGCTPEIYLGVTGQHKGALVRVGVDILSIKPRRNNGMVKVADRITTVSPFLYAQYKYKGFNARFKTIFASAGEHMNLNGGYGICGIDSDGTCHYTPTRNWSSWLNVSYGSKFQYIIFAGYVRNFGTTKPLLDGVNNYTPLGFYFSKNSLENMNRMFRLTPSFVYNMGKLSFGIEYELTGAQFGSKGLGINLQNGLYEQDLHWIANHRLQALIKYSF